MAIITINITIWPNSMIQVVIFAFEKISLFHLSVPLAIFKDAVLEKQQLFRVRVCAEHRGKITTANGLSIDIEDDISIIEQADIVIFPSWKPEILPSKRLVQMLIQAHSRQKIIAGLCLGAYALAYSGLLNSKRATTHWKFGDDFSTRFPSITCDINPLFIDEGNIITSAGSAAAIDCCLYIVKHLYGAKTANKIARMMVSSPERSGGQKQFIESPLQARPSDERLAKLIDHIVVNISESYLLEDAATFCLMSVRSFSRHFKSNNGVTFTEWLINLRLNHSLALLESTTLPITEISNQAGFSSEQVFRKHFKFRYDTTPKAWRNMFKNQNN